MYSPIEIPLRPNRRLATLVGMPWLMLGVTLALSAVPPWITLALAPVLLAGLWRDSQRLGLLRGPHAITALRITDTEVAFYDDSGWQAAEVRSLSRLFANWVWLTLRSRTSGRTRTIVLCSHPGCANTNPEALRHLRIWLRLPPNPLRKPRHGN